jgi:para-nitrobenzyl esterase
LAGAASLDFTKVFAGSGSGQCTGEAWEYVDVETRYGRIRGQRRGNLVSFKGVPYAGKVSGAARFKAAPPLQPWNGVREALEWAPPSCQPGHDYYGYNEPSPQEDCLFLNLYMPATPGKKRAVMVFNHGGGFSTGSGASVDHDGGNLARYHDVVVVETNHRLGLLGFLYLGELGGEEYATSGNQGMLDIRDALKWVHDNIEAFSGDPANVMIFGESGGGAKTSCLYAMPSAKDYFNKAAIQSGPGLRMMERDAATESTLMTLQYLGLSRSEWRKLLEVPADKLVEAQGAIARRPGGAMPTGAGRRGMNLSRAGFFSPVVDGHVLPHHPFDPAAPEISRNKPILIGTNHDEMNLMFLGQPAIFQITFDSLKQRLEREYAADAETILQTYRQSRPDAGPSDLYTAISGAGGFWMGSITLAERKCAQGGAPVYMYQFDHLSDWIIPGTNHAIGCCHAMDLPYVFDNIYTDATRPPQGVATMYQMLGSDPEKIKLAHTMSEMWATFARTGHPGADGVPEWPAYTTANRATLSINNQCKVIDDPYAQERKLWQTLNAKA